MGKHSILSKIYKIFQSTSKFYASSWVSKTLVKNSANYWTVDDKQKSQLNNKRNSRIVQYFWNFGFG